jgi:hypothetical protein
MFSVVCLFREHVLDSLKRVVLSQITVFVSAQKYHKYSAYACGESMGALQGGGRHEVTGTKWVDA